ncbi:hypothetical protein BC826DRAFT_997016 [Russula brevipes]|nr:hypothetical protein BC826DRAFT_997016 [Russula brevipes]
MSCDVKAQSDTPRVEVLSCAAGLVRCSQPHPGRTRGSSQLLVHVTDLDIEPEKVRGQTIPEKALARNNSPKP